MASQTDLDQGGTTRLWVMEYFGPSVGWVRVPARSVLVITAAGTYNLDLSTNLVQVNVAGAVIIVLPTAKSASVPAGVQPGFSAKVPVNIVDIGGNGAAHPITIQPFAGEDIMGLAQVQVTSNYGGFILYPRAAGSWTNQS